jgi:hypothetical protein
VAVCSAAMSLWPRVARSVLRFLRTRLGLPSMGRASQDPGMGPAAHLVLSDVTMRMECKLSSS